MNDLLWQSPLCQVGCATLPEDITSPVSLGETGPYDWTSRSLHLSCHTGQARSTGLFETLSLESLTRFGTLSLLGGTSTDCATDLHTSRTTRERPHTGNLDQLQRLTGRAVELQCGGGCVGALGRCDVTPTQ